MGTALPFRSRVRNADAHTAAPAALRLVATRAIDSDRPEVVLRADVDDLQPDAIRRHVLLILNTLVARFPGEDVDVQIVDDDNVPHFVASAAGGAS